MDERTKVEIELINKEIVDGVNYFENREKLKDILLKLEDDLKTLYDTGKNEIDEEVNSVRRQIDEVTFMLDIIESSENLENNNENEIYEQEIEENNIGFNDDFKFDFEDESPEINNEYGELIEEKQPIDIIDEEIYSEEDMENEEISELEYDDYEDEQYEENEMEDEEIVGDYKQVASNVIEKRAQKIEEDGYKLILKGIEKKRENIGNIKEALSKELEITQEQQNEMRFEDINEEYYLDERQ